MAAYVAFICNPPVGCLKTNAMAREFSRKEIYYDCSAGTWVGRPSHKSYEELIFSFPTFLRGISLTKRPTTLFRRSAYTASIEKFTRADDDRRRCFLGLAR